MPEYHRKKQYSGIKKPRNTNVPRYWQIISTCQVTVVFALQISTLKTWQNDVTGLIALLTRNKNITHLQNHRFWMGPDNLVTRFARNNDSSNP